MKKKHRLTLDEIKIESFSTTDLGTQKAADRVGGEIQYATMYTCDYLEGRGTVICC